ncbi:MAG TPA: amino acid adenylation domain-containing protein, partial [Longimicrobium sp.]|uniref:non-ribosomal peptide synthetase n=1 Tax=Longimicrobium sp. TaxID=2029185 RepID=UPI002ED86FE1
EVEGLIGFFVNTLVLRTDLSGDPSFREALRRVRATTLGALEHQEVPFEKLVEALRPERSLSHAPLVQVSFTLRDGAGSRPALPGLEASEVDVHTGTAKFDLDLAVDRTQDGLRVELEYATDLFDGATIGRMLGHLARLLEQAAADPDRRVSALDLLSPREHDFLAAVCASADPPADTRLFPERFARQAARTPGAVALVHGAEQVTYAELDARANRLAHRLAALGVGPEVCVGLHLPRTPEMVVAMLAVLKAGGAYVPLDARLPADRIAHVLRDCAARVLLSRAVDAARVELPAGCRALCLDAGAAVARMPDGAPRVQIHPGNLSHVIYTSGSTGRPKGVMIRHGGVASFLSAMQALLPLAPGERVLGATSLSFDVSVAEVHLSLASGATLVLVENALSLAEGDHGPLAQASMGPSAAAELLRARALPGGVRRLYLGAEPVPAELVRALYAAGVPEVHNFYGPTEDTTSSTHAALAAGVERVTVGRPLPGRRARVLDSALRPVAVGVYGEVYLAGAGEARGYLGQPGMTAERFVPDPFSACGGRMYRTGDRARWTAEGLLEYQGRTDFQVKVRGFRVEPGEVEAALRERPEVREAAVAARAGAGGGAVLAAYVVAEPGRAVNPAALREHLQMRLPAYMVPSAIVALDALPLNANGKVDRKALPAPELQARDDDYTAPRTPVEEALAGIWAELLGRDRVGIHDGFFALGGHSLLAMRLVWRIRETLDGEVDLVTLFETPTIAGLAPRLSSRAGRPAPVADATMGAARLLDMLDDLSEDELDRLLAADLDQTTAPS